MSEILSPNGLIKTQKIPPHEYRQLANHADFELDMDQVYLLNGEKLIDAGGAWPCLIAYIQGDTQTMVGHLSLASFMDVSDYLRKFQQHPQKGDIIISNKSEWGDSMEDVVLMEFYETGREIIRSSKSPSAFLFGQNYSGEELSGGSLDSNDGFVRNMSQAIRLINPNLAKEYIDNTFGQWHVNRMLMEMGLSIGSIVDCRERNPNFQVTHTLYSTEEGKIYWTIEGS